MGNLKALPLHDAFAAYLRQINTVRVRIACVLGFTLVPLFSVLDYFVIRQHFETFLKIRLACTFITLFSFLVTFSPLGKKYINLIGGMTALLIGGAISLMIRYLGGYETSYYAGLNLVMLTITVLFTWDIRITAGICTVIYGFYLIPILFYDRIEHPDLFINNNAFLLTTMIIALTSAYFVGRLRYQEFQSLYRLNESRKKLEISNDKLERLGEMKGQFFADISHELRTPLAVIRGEAEVTLRGKDKPVQEYKKVLSYITTLVEQLNKLVSDLLFLARSESGTIQIEKKEVSLQKILDEAYREGETLASRKGMEVLLKSHPGKELMVHGDPQRLKQVFLIIIDNAINYSKPGGKVEVALEQDGSQARIAISDNGVGIPEEALPHVFERFYRVEKSKAMAHGGAGLGLPIAKWIVEAHEGKIAIRSAAGSGTTVMIDLSISEMKG